MNSYRFEHRDGPVYHIMTDHKYVSSFIDNDTSEIYDVYTSGAISAMQGPSDQIYPFETGMCLTMYIRSTKRTIYEEQQCEALRRVVDHLASFFEQGKDEIY